MVSVTETQYRLPFLSGSLSRAAILKTAPPFEPLHHVKTFNSRFPQAFDLFRFAGMHPHDHPSPRLLNPYTGQVEFYDFRNIGEHSLAVGIAALKLATALAAVGMLRPGEVEGVTNRALLHDLNKPYEILRRARSDPRSRDSVTNIYHENAYRNVYTLLRKRGCATSVAQTISRAGTETGHTSLKRLLQLTPLGTVELVPGHYAEKIVHLADDMTLSTKPRDPSGRRHAFLTPWERLVASDLLETSCGYSWLTHSGLVASRGRLYDCFDLAHPPVGSEIVGSYATLQLLAAHLICCEFQQLLDPDSTLPPELFVKELLNHY